MKHLTVEQRYTIWAMIQQECKQKDIALAIGKDKSVVSRELRRNCDKRNEEYKADLAQRKYEKRQKDKKKHIYFTEEVKQHVNERLRKDLSPEQIAGRAKLEGRECVSTERIYQYVWKDKKEGGDLYTHLRRKGRRYRKRGNAKDSRGIIKDRVDISQRPEIVDRKERLGDLEIDTMIGQNHKGALLTINDRVSNKVIIEKLNGKDAKELARKVIERLSPYQKKVHTITSDNGKEFAEHKMISSELNLDFYFARPYHSWERGANENINGLIRQYFPKKTSFENISDDDVKRVEEILNNRPRKKLNFLTPNEFLLRNLSNQKVAFVT
ncbi:MAG TPA: IS30 family transposase [Bacilli bacterium]|jgi:IS30 family transposase|nr:IS30 family transposase [Bacilli bacterium]